jgi:hypothetical protein
VERTKLKKLKRRKIHSNYKTKQMNTGETRYRSNMQGWEGAVLIRANRGPTVKITENK